MGNLRHARGPRCPREIILAGSVKGSACRRVGQHVGVSLLNVLPNTAGHFGIGTYFWPLHMLYVNLASDPSRKRRFQTPSWHNCQRTELIFIGVECQLLLRLMLKDIIEIVTGFQLMWD